MLKICFVCKSLHVYKEHVRIASYLKDNGFDPFFIFINEYHAEVGKRLSNLDIRFYRGRNLARSHDTEPDGRPDESAPSRSSLRRVIGRLFRGLPFAAELRETLVHLRRLLLYRSVIEGIYEVEEPDCLILYPDRSLGIVTPAAVLAKKMGIPILVMQLGSQHVNFLAKYRTDQAAFGDYHLTTRFSNRVVLKFFPRQGMEFKDQTVLFFRGHIALMLFALGMLPRDPWHLGQSFADRYLLISDQYFADGLAQGADLRNGRVVGQIGIDDLHAAYSSKKRIKPAILSKYFGTPDATSEVVIVGLPQFFEHGAMDIDTSLDEIRYLLRSLLSRKDLMVLLSLHPKMSIADYEVLDDIDQRVKLMRDETLAESLPIADYYFSFFESTIVWAILCNVQPVYLDLYDFEVDMGVYESCRTVGDKRTIHVDLEEIFRAGKASPAVFENDRKLLPPFDGRSGERIMREIVELSK
jgi:hypothetical protein